MFIHKESDKYFMVNDLGEFWTGYDFQSNSINALSFDTENDVRNKLSEYLFIRNQVEHKPVCDFKVSLGIAVYGLGKDQINLNSLKRFLNKSLSYHIKNRFHDDAQVDVRLYENSLELD